MAKKEERLKALEQKQAQIKAQIQALKARDTAKDRKEDTRRKILIGGVVLKMVKSGEMQEANLMRLLDKNLASERDRALFGLADNKSALSPTGEAGGAVSNPQQGVTA